MTPGDDRSRALRYLNFADALLHLACFASDFRTTARLRTDTTAARSQLTAPHACPAAVRHARDVVRDVVSAFGEGRIGVYDRDAPAASRILAVIATHYATGE